MNLDLIKLLTRWTERTDYILRLERKKLNVNSSGALDKSQEYKVRQISDALLESQIEFLVRGRFVDMGAGGRARKLETREGNARLVGAKGRKPKKWYSRAYWGRINDLQGAIGFKLMEDAVNSVKNQLDDKVSGPI